MTREEFLVAVVEFKNHNPNTAILLAMAHCDDSGNAIDTENIAVNGTADTFAKLLLTTAGSLCDHLYGTTYTEGDFQNRLGSRNDLNG